MTTTATPRSATGPAEPPLPSGAGPGTVALRAARAGAEAALLGWLCAVVPAVAAYAATAALPALGEATWTQAALVGAAVWRLAHGVPADAGAWSVTLVPVGLSLGAAALAAWSLRRARVRSWLGALAATGGYAAAAAILALVAPDGGRDPGALLPGAVLVGWLGALLALGGRRGLPTLPAPVRDRLDRLPAVLGVVVPEGLRAAGRALTALAALGAGLVVASLAGATTGFGEVLASLRIDAPSTVMLVLASVALLPTLAVWAVAWVAGPGFAVGQGTVVAPGELVLGPVPALPLLAGLPDPGSAASRAPWAPLAVVVVGALAGWWLRRRLPRTGPGSGLGSAAATAAVAALGCAGAVWLLCAASSGAVGPGRMSEVGPVAVDVALAVAAEVALGALAVLVLAHGRTRALIARGAARVARDARRLARRPGAPAPGTGQIRGSAGS